MLELINAYVAIVKAEPDPAFAAQHLMFFLEDARKIAQATQTAIDAAKSRAGQQPV
jgi:hypothetical protein